MTEETITLDIPPWVYPLTVLSLLITASAAGYIYVGLLITAPVAMAGFIALFAWLGTTYRQPRLLGYHAHDRHDAPRLTQ